MKCVGARNSMTSNGTLTSDPFGSTFCRLALATQVL